MGGDASVLEVTTTNMGPFVQNLQIGLWYIITACWWLFIDQLFGKRTKDDTTSRQHRTTVFVQLREIPLHQTSEKLGIHSLDENATVAVNAESRNVTIQVMGPRLCIRCHWCIRMHNRCTHLPPKGKQLVRDLL